MRSVIYSYSIFKSIMCGSFLGSFDRSAVSLSNLKIILIYFHKLYYIKRGAILKKIHLTAYTHNKVPSVFVRLSFDLLQFMVSPGLV